MGRRTTFQARVESHGSTAFVILPHRAARELGLLGRTTARGEVNGVGFERRSIHPWDARFFVELPRRLCRSAGVSVGDTVRLVLEPTPDTEPSELRSALDAHDGARTAWGALSASRRRMIATFVADAKRPETRTRRAEGCVRSVLAGTPPRQRSGAVAPPTCTARSAAACR